jgi:general secretion pathway protein B
MSYILDALRRSQAERERGQLPHLHAQPATLGSAPVGAPARSWLLPGLAVVALLILGALVLLLLQRAQPVGGAAPGVAPVIASVIAPVTAPPSTSTIPAVQPPVATPVATAPALPIVVSAPPPAVAAAVPLVVNAKSEPQAKAPVKGALPAPVQTTAKTAEKNALKPPVPPPTKADVVTLNLAQLSPEQRRELPPLVVGGSVWSDNAASRFVILNGLLLHEGESVAPGVVVERIGPKTAWLRWRELRLELPL